MAAFDFNVLERFREDDGSVTALLHCRPGSDCADYCVAYRFDEEEGEWAYGKYTTSLAYAADLANPEVIEQATVRWTWEDLAYAQPGYPLAGMRDENHEALVAALKEGCFHDAVRALRLWKESAIAQGNEALGSLSGAAPIVESLALDPEEKIAKVLSEAADLVDAHKGYTEPMDALQLAMGKSWDEIKQARMALGVEGSRKAALEELAEIGGAAEGRISKVLRDAVELVDARTSPEDALQLAMGKDRQQISRGYMAVGRTVCEMSAFKELASSAEPSNTPRKEAAIDGILDAAERQAKAENEQHARSTADAPSREGSR